MTSFYSLENFTTYSILSGVKEPSEWVQRAADLGYGALGICDKNNLGGLIDFQKECQKHEIKPILGASFSLVDDSLEKEKSDEGNILLFVKNEAGFKNLIWLNNFAHDNRFGFHYRPRLDISIISEHSEGLIAVIPANYGGYISKPKKFVDFLLAADKAFGEDLYVGYNPADDLGPESQLYNLLRHKAQKAVPTFHCHYPAEKDANLYDVVRMIDSNKNRTQNMNREVKRAHLPGCDDFNIPDHMLESLAEIEAKCDYLIPLGTYYMPEVDLFKGETIEQEIVYNLCVGIARKLVDIDAEELWESVRYAPEPFEELINQFRGSTSMCEALPRLRMKKYGTRYMFEHDQWWYADDNGKYHRTDKGIEPLSVYWERLAYEFGVIKKLGFLDYFLVVMDICRFVDDQGEDRGAARGSAAGSLFSYLLNITKVDPIEFDLLFERFLNEDRGDLPDIDLDFSSAGRDAIKQYISDKYGDDKVCSIGSYERYKVPSAINDVAGAYGWSIPDESDELVAYERNYVSDLLKYHVPQTSRGMDELELRLEFPPFAEFYETHKTWFETVIIPLFETINNTSIHAAGTLVTKFPINECMPVRRKSDGTILTQWKDRYCEERGFPKFDILAISAVDIITYAKSLIRERHGVEIPDIEDLPLDDPETFEIFQRGQTDGVFQFKSWSQHQYLPAFRPEVFDDIVVATSVRRPGPEAVEADKNILEIKRGRAPAVYDCPEMKPITKSTYGFIIYQEQLMQTVKVIGGLTGPEADYVRKACGKKKLKDMQEWESVFKTRAKARGYDEELLNNLWDKIVAFAEYGFNKSHSVSYCLTSYQHAWIKSRYPVEFWCAALKFAHTDPKKYESVFNLKGRAKSEGFDFIFPNLYGFADDFKPHPKSDCEIFWPIDSIKGIGDSARNALTLDGVRTHFDGLAHMVEECKETVNLGVFKTLIKAGFFEPVAPTPWEAAEEVFRVRNEVMSKKDELPYEMTHTNYADWQIVRNNTFGFVVKSWKDVADFDPRVQYFPEKEFAEVPDDTLVFIGGFVEDIKIRPQKNDKNKFFARVTLTDDGEKYTLFIWSQCWMNEALDVEKKRPNKGDLFEIIGQKSSWHERPQISCNKPNTYMRVVRGAKR